MTDNKYTDEEIMEALDICTQQNSSIPCCDCPCWNDDEQECEVIDDTVILDLINRQKAEIERLKAEIERIQKARLKQAQFLAEQKAQKYELINKLSRAKTEAYKELAEKLKKKCYEDFEETDEMLAPYVTEDNIDEVLKEMMGEKDDL